MNATSVRAIGYALLLSLGCVGFCWGEPQVDTATTDSNAPQNLLIEESSWIAWESTINHWSYTLKRSARMNLMSTHTTVGV